MKFTLLKCAMFLFGILLNIPMSVFSQRTFVHPGGVHNRADLDRIKEKVLAKESPWIEGWNLMIEDSKAQYTYKAAPAESVSGPSGRRQRAARDGVAAYYNFLRWYVTGDERHAECAVNILNDWSAAVNGVITGELYQLPASIMVQVAEVVRAYPGWKADDIERFKKCARSIFIRHVSSQEVVEVGLVGTDLPIPAIWLSEYSAMMKKSIMKLSITINMVLEEVV